MSVNSVTVSYLIHHDSLLQNATAILLQNATEVYYKMRQVFMTTCNSFITKCNSYFKMRHLLQIVTVQFSMAFHRFKIISYMIKI